MVLPLARAMALVEAAYEAGARARETGPVIPHEAWQHAIQAVLREGIPMCEVRKASDARAGSPAEMAAGARRTE
jgi:hypothetical protein